MIHITPDPNFLQLIQKGTTIQQSTQPQQLQTLASLKSNEFVTKISEIYQLLAQISSISGKTMSLLIFQLFQAATSQNSKQIIQCLILLYSKPHDQPEVIQQLKKLKLDGPFALLILWTAEDKLQMIGLAELIMNSCAVDLMLTGKQILHKWSTYIHLQIQKRKLLQSIECSSNYTSTGGQMMKIIDIPL